MRQHQSIRILPILVLLGLAIGTVLVFRPTSASSSASTSSAIPLPSNASDSAAQWIRQANQALQSQQWGAAIAPLQLLCSHYPDSALYHLLLGQVHLSLQQGTPAIAQFYKARDLGATAPQLPLWIEQANHLATEEGFTILRSSHFDLLVEGGKGFRSGDSLLQAMEDLYDRLSLTLDHYPTNRFRAVVRESGPLLPGIPDWTGALFDGTIRIPLSLAQEPSKGSRLLLHEITHAFVHDMAQRPLPTWFDEGIAQSMDGTPLFKFDTANHPTIDELTNNFIAQANPQKARFLYQWSLRLARSLLNKGPGYAGVHTLLNGVAKGGNFDSLLRENFGVTSAEALQNLISDTLPDLEDNPSAADEISPASDSITPPTAQEATPYDSNSNPDPTTTPTH